MRIPDSMQEVMRNVEEQIQITTQTLKYYKKEIEELIEKLTPTNPPELMAKSEQQEALQVEMMEK
jgi:hypothetical protein